MIELFNFLWNSYWSLTGWQMILWAMYFIYFVIRTYAFWDNAKDLGVIKGYRQTIFGHDAYIRLYHIFKIMFDLPMAAIGLFLPILSKTLTFQIYKFEVKEKEKIGR